MLGRMIFTWAILLVGVCSSSSFALGLTGGDVCEERILKGGDEPFPLGAVRKIPWSQIEGEWTTLGTINYTFKINVVRETEAQTKFVMVKMIDRNSGMPLAHGVAQVRKSDKVVRAFMYGEAGEVQVSFALRDLISDDEECMGRKVFVANLRFRDPMGHEKKAKTMIMRKYFTGTIFIYGDEY